MTGDFPTLSDSEESRIGGYVLLSPIGKGSSAEVFLARHLVTGAEVAVKIINRWKSTKSFEEVTSLKMLNHPNITKLFQVINTQDQIFLCMENISGGHLLQYLLNNYPMAEEDVRAKFRQLTSAVQYCHQKAITHRDLKLENILLDGENNVKVADFGFSTKVSDDKLQTFCGTVSYMAPEILKLQPYDGRKADAWSLGVILYTMVTGQLPFEKTTFAKQKQKVLRGHFHIPDTVSVECQELLKKLLTVNPSHRITVEGIMEDQWVNIGYEEALRPYSEPPGGDIDPRVIEIMEKLGYKKEEIEDSVCQRKYDDIMGTYMILQSRQNKMVGHTIKVRPCPASDHNISLSSTQGALALGWKLEECSSFPCYIEARVPSTPPHLERMTRSLLRVLERTMFLPSPSLQVGGFMPLSSLEMMGTTDREMMEARMPSPPPLMETQTSSLPPSLETRRPIATDSRESVMSVFPSCPWSRFATDSRESVMTISRSHPDSRMTSPQGSLDCTKSILPGIAASRVTSLPPGPGPRTTTVISQSSSLSIEVGASASPSGSRHGRWAVARRISRFFFKCFCCWPSTDKQHRKRKRVKPI